MWYMKLITDVNGSVRELERDRQGGAHPGRTEVPGIVQRDERQGHGGVAPDPPETVNEPPRDTTVPDEPNVVEPNVAEHADAEEFEIGSETEAFELFGSDSDDELESAPHSPHHESATRTSRGARVHVRGDRVMHSSPESNDMQEDDEPDEMSTSPPRSPPRIQQRRRLVDSEDEAEETPYKRGRAGGDD